MSKVDEYERRHSALKAELNKEPFSGPFVVRSGRTGIFSGVYTHTGYSLSVATADRKIDAWILQSTDWTRHKTFVVPREQVEFTFEYFQGPFVNLFDLAEHLVALRTKRIDVPQLILDLEPILSQVRGAPLKTNALRCLNSRYSEFGLAVAPAKLQFESIAIRVVWIYPKRRSPGSISYYLPVGTLKFPIDDGGKITSGVFDLPNRNPLLWRLGLIVANEHRINPWKMLSPEGENEILTLLKSRSEGGHPRTKVRARKLQFIADHRDLWATPRELALLLREKGLYSKKTNLSQIVYQTETDIQSLPISGTQSGGGSKPPA